MTVKMTDVTKEDRATFGMRLKASREALGLTRPQVADMTNIPVRSVEKFETGQMSPNVERLQALAAVMEVTPEYLMTGSESEAEPAIDNTEPDNDFEYEPDHDAMFMEEAMEQLEALDKMRSAGFENYWRSAPRDFETVTSMLQVMDFDTLLDLAEKRSLRAITADEVANLNKQKEAEREEYIAEIEARIVDTAYFGIDLYKLETRPLRHLADELDVEPDKAGFLFSSWSSNIALISALRDVLRGQALQGKAIDLCDEKLYPRGEVA